MKELTKGLLPGGSDRRLIAGYIAAFTLVVAPILYFGNQYNQEAEASLAAKQKAAEDAYAAKTLVMKTQDYEANQISGDVSHVEVGDIFQVSAKSNTFEDRQKQQKTAQEYIDEGILVKQLPGYDAKPVYETVKDRDGNQTVDYVVEKETS